MLLLSKISVPFLVSNSVILFLPLPLWRCVVTHEDCVVRATAGIVREKTVTFISVWMVIVCIKFHNHLRWSHSRYTLAPSIAMLVENEVAGRGKANAGTWACIASTAVIHFCVFTIVTIGKCTRSLVVIPISLVVPEDEPVIETAGTRPSFAINAVTTSWPGGWWSLGCLDAIAHLYVMPKLPFQIFCSDSTICGIPVFGVMKSTAAGESRGTALARFRKPKCSLRPWTYYKTTRM